MLFLRAIDWSDKSLHRSYEWMGLTVENGGLAYVERLVDNAEPMS